MRVGLPDTLDQEELAHALERGGLLNGETRHRALAAARQSGTGLDRTLLELGLVPEEALYRAIADYLDLPFADDDRLMSRETYDVVAATGLSREFLARTTIIPIVQDAEGMAIAVGDLTAAEVLSSVAYRLRVVVRPMIAAPSSVRTALDRLGDASKTTADVLSSAGIAATGDVDRLRALANDGPIVALVTSVIVASVEARASDIHVEAGETDLRVRIRVDGQLRTLRTIADADRDAVTSRLKVMASLNIAEKRRPQDGRARISIRGRSIDLRVSTLPTQFGESIVLRILDRDRVALTWETLGFTVERVAQIEAIVARPHGLFLVAGPTGSGKTTTLYTALSRINSDARKIVTVEDPIEYALAGVNQVQVEPRIDMTFAGALRAILRQDPDVIMIGEIRDQETAEIAVRAALVGRLVLSTIHTNDAVAAVDRLVDLGVPKYLIAATLRGVLSQRLVRKLCEACRGNGCDQCANSGRAGRQVVSELLSMDGGVDEAISDGTRGEALRSLAAEKGFVGLSEDGRALVEQGLIEPKDLEAVL